MEYSGTHKLVNVTVAGASTLYVLVQSGSPAPTLDATWAAATQFTVPVQKVALLSSTEIQFAEVRGASHAAGGLLVYRIYSPFEKEVGCCSLCS